VWTEEVVRTLQGPIQRDEKSHIKIAQSRYDILDSRYNGLKLIWIVGYSRRGNGGRSRRRDRGGRSRWRRDIKTRIPGRRPKCVLLGHSYYAI